MTKKHTSHPEEPPPIDRRRWGRRTWDRIWDIERHYVLTFLLAVVAGGAILFWWAVLWEPNRLILHAFDITVDGWPRERPLRVAALADIHGGAPYIDAAKLRQVVALTNAQKPDLILLLGDYVILGVLGGDFMTPEEVAEGMKGLTAPLGVYAVLGNHDWWYDGQRITRAFEKTGVKVLEDTAVPLEHRGKGPNGPWLVGLGDDWTRRPDIPKAFARVPKGAPTIVATHNPDIFPRLPPLKGVVFAGHTHGGQVRLPFMGAPVVPSRYRQKYAAGYVRVGSQHMYVTTGIGTSVLPVRFRVPPEVALVGVGGDALVQAPPTKP
jgi:predicted MPP superfamily phosphohydrolase